MNTCLPEGRMIGDKNWEMTLGLTGLCIRWYISDLIKVARESVKQKSLCFASIDLFNLKNWKVILQNMWYFDVVTMASVRRWRTMIVGTSSPISISLKICTPRGLPDITWCPWSLGCFRKTLFQENQKYNPSSISLGVSLKGFKSFFYFFRPRQGWVKIL